MTTVTAAQKNCTKTILVVEDDIAILETLQELLESEGYHVVKATNGKEALAVLAKCQSPCVILLDLFMPIMDGWQFLDHLKEEREAQSTPTPIVITSAAGDRAADAAKRVQGYIKKPIELELLLTTIMRFCGAHPAT